MFKKFIVATDLSEGSSALVNDLGGLKDYGAEECLLVQCISMQQAAALGFSYDSNKVENSLKRQKETLERQGYKVETRTVTGAARTEVNRIAEKEDYSLIVVGAEEDSLASEVFSSGVSYEIIHRAKKPVLLIRLTLDESDGANLCIRSIGCGIDNHILFPTDFSQNADKAFEYLIEMAKSRVVKVTLVHVQDEKLLKRNSQSEIESDKNEAREKLENMKKMILQNGSVEVESIVAEGSPSVEILKLIDEKNAQLVVMGSQGRGFVKELFLGSVGNNIVRHSKSSVLLVTAR